MSSLRRQDVRRKSRKKGYSSTPGTAGAIAKVLWRASRIPLTGVLFLAQTFKKYPRFSFISFAVIGALFSLGWTSHAIYSHMESRLPTSIVIHSGSAALIDRINTVTWDALQKSRAKKESRTQFLKTLSSRLDSVEGIDEFHMRTGLDKKLQIWAAEQKPAFVLEGAEGRRVLISTRMIAVSSVLPDTIQTGVPSVLAPEAVVSQRATVKDGSRAFAVAGINLPRLFRQITTIMNAGPKLSEQNFQLKDFSWKKSSGLSVRLSRSPTPPSNMSQTLSVVLGDTEMEPKVERLLKVIEHFGPREVVPEAVDLNYPDRAIIRMGLSDAGTPASF